MPDRGFRSGHHGIAGGHLFQISGDEHSPSLAPVKQRLRTGEIRCGIGPATSTSTPLTRSQCRFTRSEEHTSELQSPDHLVCRLLLEKKNRKTNAWSNSSRT